MEITEITKGVHQVNQQLNDAEPRSITYDDYKENTGYKPQYVIDAMNDAFMGIWGFSELSSEIVPTPDGKGLLAVCKVEVWIEGINWKPSAYGESNVTRGALGDARKGAQTDAIKKALCYFSIGSRAYKGEIPYIKKESRANNNRTANSRPAGNTGRAVSGSSGSQQDNARPAVTTTTAPVAKKEEMPTVKSLKQEVASLGLDWNKTLIAAYRNVIDDGRMTESRLIQLWAQPEVSSVGINKLWKYIQTLKTENAA